MASRQALQCVIRRSFLSCAPRSDSFSTRSGPFVRAQCSRGCAYKSAPLTSRPDPKGSRCTAALAQVSYIHSSESRWNEHIFNIQDEADFAKRVTKNSTPVVVDFHATWCGPCKLLGPRLEALIASKNGTVVLAKIDIDEMTELAVSHGVEAVPTVLAMKDGKIVDRFVGLKDDAALESFVQSLVN